MQTQAVLESLVVKPPPAEMPAPQVDARDLPRSRADGAYGNRPTQSRANAAGFRMESYHCPNPCANRCRQRWPVSTSYTAYVGLAPIDGANVEVPPPHDEVIAKPLPRGRGSEQRPRGSGVRCYG
ncbi:MAG TPA: hypothetical protein VMF69_18245 [Gemmataceae bacterium]|nr:hypothetical protein [Gemmataceae bacterium]